jgi:hypothetical protein
MKAHFSTARVIAYMLALFVAGAATGAMLAVKLTKDQMYRAPSGSELKSRLRGKLLSRLDLSADQIKRIDPIVGETAARLQETHRDSVRRTGQIMKDFNARIGALLTPAQRNTLEELEQERQEFIQRKCRPRSSGSREPSGDRSARMPAMKESAWPKRSKLPGPLQDQSSSKTISDRDIR